MSGKSKSLPKLNQRECCRATRAGTGSKAGPLPGLRTVCALLERSQQHYSSRSRRENRLKVRQSQVLWQRYKQEGLAGMLTYPFEGTVGKLMSHYGPGNFLRDVTTPLTQQQIADWIKDSFGVEYKQSGISKLFQRLKLKLKTDRPSNVRKDERRAGF